MARGDRDHSARRCWRAARPKGVGEATIIFVHALRNSCLSIITVAGGQTVGIVNGAVIVETVFGGPGVGKLMIDAILQPDFALVMLAESGLSILGIGIQPPDVTWGLMVAQGRNCLNEAWWLAFFPGVAIMLATLSANIVSNWLRVVMDPSLVPD